MDISGHHWIGSQPSRAGTATFQATAPATGEALEPFYAEATSDEIDRAFTLAVRAQATLRGLPRERRARLLERIADGLEALGEGLLERASLETALPLPRLTGERGRTTDQLRRFAEHVREGSWLEARLEGAQPERAPLPKPDLRSIRQAVGPVVVFGASNFPLAFSVAGGDTASALAAGCPVIVKAHPHHPATSELVARVIVAAVSELGLPPGTFSLLHGRGHQVGAELVTHPDARAVGFTGSFAGGKALFDLAAARPRPIPVFAEMGSVNPVLLLPGAVASRSGELAAGLAGSVTLGVGQFCTNPGLLVALAGDATEELVTALGVQLDDSNPGTLLHDGIRAGYEAGLSRLANVRGVRRFTFEPPVIASSRSVRAAGFRTDAATFRAHPELGEEVFGPATLLGLCSDAEELQNLVEDLDGQLTATVHASDEDLDTFGGLVDSLTEKAGRLVFGGYPTGVEVCPAMHHGGPFPATTDAASTSVGTAAIRRFTRPVCYQDAPMALLPPELRDANPDGILRLVDGEWSRAALRA